MPLKDPRITIKPVVMFRLLSLGEALVKNHIALDPRGLKSVRTQIKTVTAPTILLVGIGNAK